MTLTPGTRLGPQVIWSTVLSISVLSLSTCGSPTGPDRTGYIGLRIVCDVSGASPLACRAETYCSGLYRCPDPAADGRNVTGAANWTSTDAGIVRMLEPGSFEAVGSGNTVINAMVPEAATRGFQTVAVFEGTAPLPTGEMSGRVYEAGRTVGTGAISGAVVEVRSGLFAGRTAVSGAPPSLLPGFLGREGGSGYYRFVGVPPGAYVLRTTMPGYVGQERTVVVTPSNSPLMDFPLARP